VGDILESKRGWNEKAEYHLRKGGGLAKARGVEWGASL